MGSCGHESLNTKTSDIPVFRVNIFNTQHPHSMGHYAFSDFMQSCKLVWNINKSSESRSSVIVNFSDFYTFVTRFMAIQVPFYGELWALVVLVDLLCSGGFWIWSGHVSDLCLCLYCHLNHPIFILLVSFWISFKNKLSLGHFLFGVILIP